VKESEGGGVDGAVQAVLHPIYRSGDPNCCPTGGYRYRRFGWDGSRFVVSAEQVLDEVPPGFYRG